MLQEIIERQNGEFFHDADATSLEEVRAATGAPLADRLKAEAGGASAARSGRLALQPVECCDMLSSALSPVGVVTGFCGRERLGSSVRPMRRSGG